jgi:hypothetical protein
MLVLRTMVERLVELLADKREMQMVVGLVGWMVDDLVVMLVF